MLIPFAFYLDWLPNAQFAGLCFALDRGLYEAAGLDVRLVPWRDDGRSIIDKVASGGLCAGSSEDNLVVAARAHRTAPVTAIGAMFQETPLVVMSRLDRQVTHVRDLAGKRVAMHCDGIRILEALLAFEGVARDVVDITEVEHSLDNLLDDRYDAVQGYWVSEPLELRRRGLDVQCLQLKHHRLHPYAQVFFATEAVVVDHRDTLSRFLAASLAGWEAALADPASAIAAIDAVGHPAESAEMQRLALDRVDALFGDNNAGRRVGRIDMARWARNIEAYRQLGIAPKLTAPDCALNLSLMPDN